MSVGGKNHRVLHMLYTLNNKGKGVLQQPQKKRTIFSTAFETDSFDFS